MLPLSRFTWLSTQRRTMCNEIQLCSLNTVHRFISIDNDVAQTGTFSSFRPNVCCLFFRLALTPTIFAHDVRAPRASNTNHFQRFIFNSAFKIYLVFLSSLCFIQLHLANAERSIYFIWKLSRTYFMCCCQMKTWYFHRSNFRQSIASSFQENPQIKFHFPTSDFSIRLNANVHAGGMVADKFAGENWNCLLICVRPRWCWCGGAIVGAQAFFMSCDGDYDCTRQRRCLFCAKKTRTKILTMLLGLALWHQATYNIHCTLAFEMSGRLAHFPPIKFGLETFIELFMWKLNGVWRSLSCW